MKLQELIKLEGLYLRITLNAKLKKLALKFS